MIDAIAHRGPDGEGQWSNGKNTVHLGHRRLAIIDQSAQAAQPMAYNNRYQIVYNGEIYNYLEIRSFLKNHGYNFNSRSDTEVVVAAYDYWKEKCLQQFDGMFAFAIWDEKTEQLFVARDRFGEKPFYYYEDEENFIFASEMKALWAIGIERQVNNKMMLNYLTLGHVQNCVDKEQTFFDEIYSLPPSYYLTVTPASGEYSKITRYWSINKELKLDISFNDACDRFNDLLIDSVKRRLRSDVPVGTSLSGGLDSSTIAYTIDQLQKIGGQKNPDNLLKTFSSVFPGSGVDESHYIDVVTRHLNISNFKTTPTVIDLVNDFEKLCYHQEEPFSSSSVYAQFSVFALAKQHGVKVLLDGQGADEFLAGYPRYIHWFLQEVLSRHRIGATQAEKAAFRKNDQPFQWGLKNILAAFLPSHTAMMLEKKEYRKTISHPDISTEFLNGLKHQEWVGIHKPIVTKLNDILHFNITEMGLEELLRFADRNSMAHGVEVRLPFLNHDLATTVFSLPAQMKMHAGWTKYLMRKAMNKKLPDEIIWRRDKIGFEPPQKNWMQHPELQDYMQEAKRKLVNAGILNIRSLENKIEPLAAHADKNYDWRYLCAAQII